MQEDNTGDIKYNLQSEEDMQDLLKFEAGEWLQSERVQELLGLSFKECWERFDFSRTAGWWSLVGKTKEERQREGQKVTIYFRKKQDKTKDLQ